MEIQPHQIRPSELYGDFWLNGDPVSLRAEAGRVALVDFWDFTDPESLRGVRYVREWHERYRDSELIVVGVHVPQFGFGKNPERLAEALRHIGISYPVMMDNEGIVTRSYDNHILPTRYLVDKDGFLRMKQEGTAGPERLERSIQALLRETGLRGPLPEPVGPIHPLDTPGIVRYPATDDIQLGYLRGVPGNPEAYSPESTLDYADPGSYLPGRFYASGKWRQEREFFRYEGEEGETGALAVRCETSEVFAVLENRSRSQCRVEIMVAGAPLPDDQLGQDVRRGAKGESVVVVDTPRLYHLVRGREHADMVLHLRTRQREFCVYAFSFVSAPVPEFLPPS